MKVTTVEADVVLAEAEELVRVAATAVALSQGPAPARALLNVPDAELGMLVKEGITRVLTTQFFLSDSPLPSGSEAPVRSGDEPTEEPFDRAGYERKELQNRQQLIVKRQLLAPSVMWESLHVTRQALNKALSSGRIFTVDVGAEQYYPAFYLGEVLDRRKLEKVTQLLGDLPGWSKWQFFTTPKASLDGITPLVALERGMFEQVKDAAEAFAER